jgi:hypothetical protein
MKRQTLFFGIFATRLIRLARLEAMCGHCRRSIRTTAARRYHFAGDAYAASLSALRSNDGG